MSDSVLESIIETDDQFNEALVLIKKDIRLELLSMTEAERKGFFISQPSAFNWLRLVYKNTNAFRQNFKRQFLQANNYFLIEAKSETDYDAHYIYRNNTEGDTRIKLPWFSDEGFKILCMVMKSPKAMLVRAYFLELEKEHIAIMKMKLSEVEALQKKTLKEIKQKQEEHSLLKAELTDYVRAYDKLEDRAWNYYNQNLRLVQENENLQDIKRSLYNYYDNLDPDGRNYELRLQLYERMFGMPVLVYLVSDKWVLETLANELTTKPKRIKKPTNTKEVNEMRKQHKFAPEEEHKLFEPTNPAPDVSAELAETTTDLDKFREAHDLLQYNLLQDDIGTQFVVRGMDYNSMTPAWIKDYVTGITEEGETREFYFYFSAKGTKAKQLADKSKLWATLYFANNTHYTEFLAKLNNMRLAEHLGDNAKLIKTKVLNTIYKVPYEEIVSAHRGTGADVAFRTLYPKPTTNTTTDTEEQSTIAYEA